MYKTRRTKPSKNTTITNTFNTRTGKNRITFTNRTKNLTQSWSTSENGKTRHTQTFRHGNGWFTRTSKTTGGAAKSSRRSRSKSKNNDSISGIWIVIFIIVLILVFN